MISTNEGRGGTAPRVLPNRRALRRSLDAWKRAAIGLFVLAVLCNAAQALVYNYLRGQLEQEVQQAEESRDSAIQELAAVSLASAQEKQARAHPGRRGGAHALGAGAGGTPQPAHRGGHGGGGGRPEIRH